MVEDVTRPPQCFWSNSSASATTLARPRTNRTICARSATPKATIRTAPFSSSMHPSRSLFATIVVHLLGHLQMVLQCGERLARPILQLLIIPALGIAFEQR